MTTQEFSNEFDILYNNIMSNQAPGLDEYEKSVFLTKAQMEILKNYFNPTGNKYGQGFDGSEKRQIDFSTLVEATVLTQLSIEESKDYIKFDDRSILYKMPNDVLLVLNETAVKTENNIQKLINIVPIDYIEYSRIISKPYKQPLKNQGWRLFQSSGGIDYISEVIVKFNSSISNYKLRYVKRPLPIILTDLDSDYSNISIDGITSITECQLDPILHPEILQRAVELAKAAYIGDINSTLQLGQRSE